MSTLYERLDSLCKERGIKGGRMCVDLGMSKSLMTDLKSGRKKGVNAETAQKIASYFGVSVAYLLGEEDKKEKATVQDDGLSDNHIKLIEMAKTISDEDAAFLLAVLQAKMKQ